MQAQHMTQTTDAPTSIAARAAALLYGSVAYVGFLGTYLFAIGWVTGLLPRNIDNGPVGGLGEALVVNLGVLSLFAIQHTIMARGWFKAKWTKICPPAVERSTFVVITCVILLTLFTQWRPLEGELWHVEGVGATVLQGLSFAGFALVVVATFLIDHFELFGLKQVVRYFRGTEHTDPPFLVRSLYRYTRHPLYVGFIMAFWFTPHMTYSHLLFAAVTTGYLMIGIQFEEHDLIRMHGDKYREYKAQVPSLLPIPGKVWK